MSTGIYREGILGLEEVPQKHIDAWCAECQFPIEKPKCQAKENIQRCWNEVGTIAHVWHLLHECPFAHLGQDCRCNDFKSVRDAFVSLGLTYHETK